MPAGIPTGYNSKGDFFKGITSQMRDNEKSSSPGYPGNQTSVAKKLSQLKDQEKSVLQFKPLSSMKVDASDVSAFVQKLDTEKSNNNINLVQSQKGRIDSQEDRLKPFSNDGISSLASINPSDYAEMGSGGPGTLADDQRVHEAAYIADKIKAEFAKGINFDGVNTLTDTYKPGDAGLARQLESKTYGVDNDRNLVTPGYETKLIDEFADTHGKSEENIASAAAAVAAEQAETQAKLAAAEQLILDEKETIGNKRFGLANSGTISDADKEIFKEARKQRAYDASVEELAESVRDAKGEFKEVDLSQGIHHDTSKVVKQKIEDEFKLVTEGTAIIDAEKVLDEVADERKKREWEEYKLRSQERTRENFEDALDTSTPPETFSTELAKGSEELQDALKSGEINNNSIGFNIAEQTAQAEVLAAEKAKKERLAELHNQQINSTTADDIADVKPSNAVAQQTEILAANLQDNKEKAVKVDKPSKSQIEKKYPPFKTLGNGDGSLHGKDPFRFTTLEYPTNITSDEQYGHFILFYVNVQNKTKYKYIGYNDDGNVKIVGDVVEKQVYYKGPSDDVSTEQGFNVTSDTEFASGNYTTRYFTENNAGAEEVAYQKAQSYSLEGGGNILQSNQVTLQRQRPATQGIGSRMDLTSRITDSVALYLPSEIGNSTSTKYQGAELGMLGYLALGGADLLGQLQNRDFAGMGDTAVGMIDAAITEGLKKSAVTAADLFSGASTQGSIDKVFGQTVNPFIEVAFESMGVRSFEYTFNFTPKSKEETEEVKAIIQLFRFHMVPELKGTNHRYLTLPSTFDIHYMYQSSPEVTKENTYYNKIATCVLEDCNVNYAPTGVKSFDDGAPTQITMTLRFMETEMLTKEKINKGF